MAKWQEWVLDLSKNKKMNESTRATEPQFGAQTIIAGTTSDEMVLKAKQMNAEGMRVGISYLGEHVYSRQVAREATNEWLKVIDEIATHNIDAYLSIKLSQIGLDIEGAFCFENAQSIVEKAEKYGIYVSFDMEDYKRLDDTYHIYDRLKAHHDNLAAEVQAYLYRSEEDIKRYDGVPLRIVRGSFDERIAVAFQTEEEINEQFKELIKYRLDRGDFTTIATQNREIIRFVRDYVKEHDISQNTFEFQFLYGLHEELRAQLKREGFKVAVFIPYGEDWYAYYMRRLAEHPEHLKLVKDDVINKKTLTIAGLIAGAFVIGNWIGRRKK